MTDVFLQMCINLWIMFLNAFVYLKTTFLGIPYFKVLIILLSAFFTYKMSLGELKEVKAPYQKAGRRRI